MLALKIVRYVTWAAIAILSAALLYLLLSPRTEGGSTVAIGTPFALAGTSGGRIDSEKLKGKPYALFFGFTNCPDVCPTSMLEITNDLKALDPLAKDFKVYFITVDPERDTVDLLRDYTGSFDPRIIGLVPKDEAELEKVAKGFRAIYRKVPTPSSYTMDHTASIFLMDSKGQFFGTLDSKETPAVRQAKLKRLMEKG
jgi:protein SCO1/2